MHPSCFTQLKVLVTAVSHRCHKISGEYSEVTKSELAAFL